MHLLRGSDLKVRIMQASGAAVLLKVLSTLLGFGVTILLARHLGPDSYGVYAFALAVVMVVGLPAKAGVPQLVTRETAKGHANGDWSTIKGIWRWSTGVVGLISVTVIVVAAGIGAFFPAYLETEQGLALGIGILLVPLIGLALVRSSSLRGLGHTVQGQLPELAIKPLVFLVFVSVVVWLGVKDFSASQAMGLNVVATGVAFLIGAALLYRARPLPLQEAKPLYQTRTWLPTIIPMAAINAMHLINTQADILLIGLFMESADVGHYKVAAQTSLVVAFGLQATKMVAEPYFSRFYQQGDKERLQRLAKGAARLNLLIALPVFGALLAFGTKLLELAFGAAFISALLPLLILSGGRLGNSALGSSGHLLTMAGYHKEYARFWIVAAVLNVAMNLLLIPIYGTAGAAASTAFTLLLANGLGWWAAKKWVGCDCSPLPSRS